MSALEANEMGRTMTRRRSREDIKPAEACLLMTTGEADIELSRDTDRVHDPIRAIGRFLHAVAGFAAILRLS